MSTAQPGRVMERLPRWLGPANHAIAWLQRRGIAFFTFQLLTVPGRVTGQPRTTPVSPKPLLDQWVADTAARLPGIIASITGGTPRQITKTGPSYWHGWSPDGKMLGYAVGGVLTVLDIGSLQTTVRAYATAGGFDWSGNGEQIAANKIPGIRAGVCHDVHSAHQGVEHDDMNVLCLGARVIGEEIAREIVSAFLSAHYLGDEPGQEAQVARQKRHHQCGQQRPA